SIPTAEPATPEPTYGTPASSKRPWTVPSSPLGPCRTGKTTSKARRSASSAGGRPPTATRPGPAGSARNAAGTIWASRSFAPSLSAASGSSPTSHRPSLVMPMGITSYLAGSSAFMTDSADIRLTSCSPDRPPKRTATRTRWVNALPPGAACARAGSRTRDPDRPGAGAPRANRMPLQSLYCTSSRRPLERTPPWTSPGRWRKMTQDPVPAGGKRSRDDHHGRAGDGDGALAHRQGDGALQDAVPGERGPLPRPLPVPGDRGDRHRRVRAGAVFGGRHPDRGPGRVHLPRDAG